MHFAFRRQYKSSGVFGIFVRLWKRLICIVCPVLLFVQCRDSGNFSLLPKQPPVWVQTGITEEARPLLFPKLDSLTSTSYGLAAQQIPLIGTMVLNRPDLLLSLLNSIDYPVKRFVIVHNLDSNADTNRETEVLLKTLESTRSEILEHDHISTLTVVRHDQNLGFSAGVNRIVLSNPNAPYWLVVNNDVAFRRGALQEIAKRLSNNTAQEHEFCAWAMVGEPIGPFSAFVLTRLAVEKVGFWDENFWPVYGEDCDYEARLVRANCPMVFEQNTSRLARHVGSASWRTTRQTSSLSELVGRGNNNFDYIESKWGSNVCNARKLSGPYMETVGYDVPFNRMNATLAEWSVDMERRLRRGGPRACVLCSSERASDLLNEQRRS